LTVSLKVNNNDTNPQEEANPYKEVRESVFENAFRKSPLFMTILEKLKEVHPNNLVLSRVQLIVGQFGFTLHKINPDYTLSMDKWKENEIIGIVRYDDKNIYVTQFCQEVPVPECFFKGLRWEKVKSS
jgi:hypothetical protein